VRVVDLDLRHGYPDVAASLTLCVLTLQFTPVAERARILRDAFAHTRPGGALVVVEKVLSGSARAQRVMTAVYHDLKRTNGYGEDEIRRKALSLEGVLVPLAAAENEALLRQAGFGEVECVWRWLSFGAWLAVRSGDG
jgi:tRNA (cmo5U34)-methyltransferase